ncbi:hypothetical protein CJ030_MR0G005040 [Morella rubra]|uniref:Uncharacterized protein n=1 Tax=Morella rubra TaxID=262757 RepID=A0A6A1UMY7_9ROSI|nr:hypothetical protein CJ030_MR0G005040 [Morella rubra]
MFEFQGWETLVSIKENCYVYLVKLVFANFQFSKSEDADSYVNGKMLDLSSSSLNSLANAPDDGKKFFENHGWAANEKKNQGLPYGMFFTRVFQILEIDLGGEVRVPPMDSREYNHKTLKLMGFQQNTDGVWVKKADATPQKRSHRGSVSEAQTSFVDIKEEQRRLGQQLEKLSLDMKTGFDDIKKLFAAHDERFNLLDKDVRLLKHQVNNSVRVATDVIQATVK